ncbi:recombinase family protein [Faecalibacterium duncaniae]|uniref:recombinase family protein n=1 Tax=Faecalibacterium duncaniae (strain DSM 17677 / JCM 31915 / A2-165) TaxID=411483 RepID=UPI003ED9D8C8
MTAVIYARYSSDSQREASIEGQLRDCKDYAEKNGITVVGTYIDRAYSAKTDDRPDFQRMIKDSAKKIFDVVLVWKLDRFARNRFDAVNYKYQLEKNGVHLVSAMEPISQGPEGIMVESMLIGMAEYYSAELALKVARGERENALQCKYNGGVVPLGFTIGKEDRLYHIDPETAPIVQEIFSRYADGEPAEKIAASLNERGLRTRTGKPFVKNSFFQIFRNRRYIGEYRYKDIVTPGGIPAIVDEDLFNRVQQRFEQNKIAHGRPAKEDVSYLLTTKLFCGKCGTLMGGESGTSHMGNTYYYYKCGNAKRHGKAHCDLKAIRKEPLERFVVETAIKVIFSDEIIERLIDLIMEAQQQENTRLPVLKDQLRDTEKRLANLLEAIEQGILTPTTKQRLDELEARKEALNTSILEEELKKPVLTREWMRFWFEKFRKGDMRNMEHQRQIIDTFVNSVYVFDDRVVLNFNFTDDSKTISREEVLGSSAVDNAPPKKHEGFGLRASFLLIHTVLCSSGRFCLPPLRQILLSAANCIRSRRPVILGGKWNETMEEQTMKYGVIDVGGGLRGIYGAGVLDRCLEENLRFDLCIGVSAGSANMASYLAGQHGRNKPFYDEYSFRREYMSVHNLIHKHSYLDLGYVYGTLSNAGGENPLDYAALARSPAELCVVAANAQNGEAQYFTKADLHPDDYRVLMASCCIPVIDQPCVIDGVPYFDGGLADPVPLEWAFAHGCDRVALILTKPIGLVRSDALDEHLAHLLQSHYPAAAEGLRRRAWRYNTAVQRARELERQGLVCIIAPDSTEGMSTLTKNRAGLEKMYAKGKQDAEALVRWMQNTKQDESVGTWR